VLLLIVPLIVSKVSDSPSSSELILTALVESVIFELIILSPTIFLKAPVLETPVPFKVMSSPAPIVIVPDNCKAAPSATEVLPSVVPRALLFAAVKTPAEIVVVPV